MTTSKEIAGQMNLPHKEIMDFYWHLEEMIVTNRRFIKCTLVIEEDSENWLNNVCESLEFAFYVHFNKLNSLNFPALK